MFQFVFLVGEAMCSGHHFKKERVSILLSNCVHLHEKVVFYMVFLDPEQDSWGCGMFLWSNSWLRLVCIWSPLSFA